MSYPDPRYQGEGSEGEVVWSVPVLAEGGTPEWWNGGWSSPLLAERAHQIHRIVRKSVLVQARSRRRINHHS